MSVINATPLLAAAGGDYQISRSVRLRSSASAYFNRTPASAGNRQKFTWSGWVKRGSFPTGANSVLFSSTGSTYGGTLNYTYGSNQDKLYLQFDGGNGGSFATNAVFRDPSAWYHVVVAVDTTQATSTNRVLVYVNNLQQTFSSSTYPSQNYNTEFNTTSSHGIGAYPTPNQFFDGYLTEVNFIDGQALTPSDFGETDSITGVWKPKKYAGTYGTNGFYLNFSDNSAATAAAIGKDNSGNGNNWTPNNISVTAGVTYDSMLDVPTLYADGGNGRGNYAVLNPLDKSTSANLTVLNGNLSVSNSASTVETVRSTIAMPTAGKWYFEYIPTGLSAQGSVGIAASNIPLTGGVTSGNCVLYQENAVRNLNGSAASYGSSFTVNDVIGVAYNADSNEITFYKNNVSQGAISVTAGFTYFPCVSTYYVVGSVNFGQRPFAYTPPTGFKALNTQNLPDSTIKKGNAYFDATTYTGTGSALTVTNSGSMQPDLVWIKSRSNVTNHNLTDAVRGVDKLLFSNATAAEATFSGGLSSFNSGGFSLASGGDVGFSASGYTYVGWQWKANGAAVSNTAGSISSQVSANTTAGFSVVTFTSPASGDFTVGHGLGVAPSFVIRKSRGSVESWLVGCDAIGWTKYLNLDSTNAALTAARWGNTAPTSSVFTNGSGFYSASTTYVAYCYAPVAGFSKFGSYTGNGSADGPFVFCGFRPRWVLIKKTTGTASDWHLLDTARSTSNITNLNLSPNTSDAESANTAVNNDLVSNGFKLRSSHPSVNGSGETYIFACFAENPFKNSLAR